jgi:magnesium-transporting ATPase (P-type)
MLESLIVFGKVFGLLIILFIGVMILFVYPTNILYKNEKIEPKGDTDKILIGTAIFLAVIIILLYYYYHISNSYMCNISAYFDCLNDSSSLGIYVLLFIHLALIIAFNLAFINKLKELIKSKKLDMYLFLFASGSIFLVLFNYKIYENIFENEILVYLPIRMLLYLIVYSPVYLYLLINYILNPTKRKKSKKKVTKKK